MHSDFYLVLNNPQSTFRFLLTTHEITKQYNVKTSLVSLCSKTFGRDLYPICNVFLTSPFLYVLIQTSCLPKTSKGDLHRTQTIYVMISNIIMDFLCILKSYVIETVPVSKLLSWFMFS